MTWPRQIYVATKALGVYHTEDFVDPSTQPTWTAVNTGLAATDCREFYLDPFNQVDRQYVLLEASRTLYRRENDGDWTGILTSAQAAAITGQATTMVSFCPDPTTVGRIYAVVKADAFWEPVWCLRSDDYGATWPVLGVVRAGWYTYGANAIRATSTRVYAVGGASGGNMATYWSSADNGANWTQLAQTWLSNSNTALVNQLLPNQFYTNSDPQGNGDLERITSAGAVSELQDGLAPLRNDSMWFHPTDSGHQRLLRNGAIYVTADEWANVNSPSAITPTPYSFAPWAGSDTDQILAGITIGGGANPVQSHVIGALYGEDDVSAVGIAGANSRYSPFADSIPYTCGGAASMGIQAIAVAPQIRSYGVAME